MSARLSTRPHCAILVALVALSGCTATIEDNGQTAGSGGAAGTGPGPGPTPGPSAGGTATTVGGSGNVAAAAGVGNPGAGAGGSTGETPPPAQCADQAAITPGRAPMRRLTKFEYNSTIRDILGDKTQPAFAFPSELSGNKFGNDADAQPVSSELADQYAKVAEGVASRATATPAALALLATCAGSVTAATQASCARTVVDSLLPKAFRRPLVAGEADQFVALFDAVQTANGFASGIAAVIEAALQSPDFLYKVEFGVADSAQPNVKRPSGPEMATRLSYLFWGTSPDAVLTTAANSGQLLTSAGVRTQAERLLADLQSRTQVRFFFDNLLPIANLTDLARDPLQFPTFNATIGSLMQQETRTFLEYQIFDPSGPGTLTSVFNAPYTFVNQQLASYYGMTGVTGESFQKKEVDTTQRLGVITQGGVLVGTTPSNKNNPVLRGSFIVNVLMCADIELPSNPEILAKVTPPGDETGATSRERFSKHSSSPECAGCHAFMDPMGFALENYDAVGKFRTTENGVTIDASGNIPGMTNGSVSGPIELAQKLAVNRDVQNCFASRWADFAYGQSLHKTNPQDVCNREALGTAFQKHGYNVKQLLVELTQTDAFLYLGSQE